MVGVSHFGHSQGKKDRRIQTDVDKGVEGSEIPTVWWTSFMDSALTAERATCKNVRYMVKSHSEFTIEGALWKFRLYARL